MSTAPPTGSSTSSTGVETPVQDLQSAVTSALKSADTNATETVQAVQQVQTARLSGLKRTAASLTAQYGANSPQAQQAQAAVTATSNAVNRLTLVHQQITTPTPQVSATGWALQGRVYNSSLQAVSGYTVFLVDATKTFQQAYGFAYTDSTGYFLINYAGTSTPPGAPASAPTLYIEIANTKALPVYISTTAFSPATGSVTYQSITLPAGEKPLGDPPEEIRKIALPEQPLKGK